MIHLRGDKYLYIPDTNFLINHELRDNIDALGRNVSDFLDIPLRQGILQTNFYRLKQVIFEITRSCNLNCLYCSYNGKYFYQRKHSSDSLDINTAKEGLDYLYRFFGDRGNKKLAIGFYGGEPLLGFQTIEKIVPYSLELFQGWELSFLITTNASLLTPQIIRFLIRYQFDITISIDGPQKNHDAKRIFRKDGKGTHQAIIDILKQIKNMDESYFKKNVSFNITHSNDLPLLDVYDFFCENNLVNQNLVAFTRVNFSNSVYYQEFPFDLEHKRQEYRVIFNCIKEKLKAKEKLYPIEDAFLADITQLETQLKIKKTTTLASCCSLDNRLFIDAFGRFHICEKMNDQFAIGQVSSGIDFARVEKLMQEFINLNKKYCRHCEVRFLCQRCFVHFAGNGNLVIDPGFCENNKKIFYRLERLIELKEENLI